MNPKVSTECLSNSRQDLRTHSSLIKNHKSTNDLNKGTSKKQVHNSQVYPRQLQSKTPKYNKIYTLMVSNDIQKYTRFNQKPLASNLQFPPPQPVTQEQT